MQSTSDSPPSNQHLSKRGDRRPDRRPPGAAPTKIPQPGGPKTEGVSPVDRYWDAALEDHPDDLAGLLDQGGEELRSAAHLHHLLRELGRRWRGLQISEALDRSELLADELLPQTAS